MDQGECGMMGKTGIERCRWTPASTEGKNNHPASGGCHPDQR